MNPTQPRAAETEWLHQGGSAAHWGSLGLWQGAEDSYAQACAALASAVASAAGLKPGHRVLSIGCGAGEELLLWRQRFGAGVLIGIEADARFADQGTNLSTCSPQSLQTDSPEPLILVGNGTRLLDAQALRDTRFDCVLCVDAAYHFQPRSHFLQGAWKLLRPGGRLAYTDLVLQPQANAGGRMNWQGVVVQRSAQLCGVPAQGLLSVELQTQRLRDLGFEEVSSVALGDQVLDGFADFVKRKRGRWRRAAWRPALTAALIPACRAAGLSYALLSAAKPLGDGSESG